MRSSIFLRTRLLLLLLPESKQGDTRDLDDLETDTGNITLSTALTTETSEQDLVVSVKEVQATITGNEGSDLLAVLLEQDTDTLADGRVGLLGLNTDLLQNDTTGVRSTTEGRVLVGCSKKTLLVLLVGPTVLATGITQFASGSQSSRLGHCV